MRDTSPSILVALVAMFALSVIWDAASEAPTVSAILTSVKARTEYLAHARIWKHPGVLSPDDVLDGPSGVFPYTFAQVTGEDGIACTFTKPGKELSGKTPKFVCQTSDGRTLRVKYWDRERAIGNREVFATVAATRLMWALGFEALHALPMNVRCDGCPTNPMTGEGRPSAHRYLAELQAFPPTGPLILSRDDREQGWSWRELDDAIATLPPGAERTRQRRDFDALTLLGVFMQHGDRKPDQQLLYCDAPADLSAGEIRPWESSTHTSILLERPDATSCPRAAAMIFDVGATFGGAGRTSNDVTSKMNLDQWRSKPIFKDEDGGVCRGRLTVSLAAGRDAEANPVISEDGRQFLLEQLQRLTPAHVRAIFTAARVTTIDEWVAAFQDKVRQIDAHRCQPAP